MLLLYVSFRVFSGLHEHVEGGAEFGMRVDDLGAGFKVMKFPEPIDPDVVCLEEQTGALYFEKPEDVHRYSLMFDFLRALRHSARKIQRP